MKKFKSIEPEECPIITVQKVLSGKWSLAIIYYLGQQTLRFNELQRKLPFLTQATLSRQIKELVALGIVNRKDYQEIPPKVEYSLSEIGMKLIPIIRALEKWSEDYLTFISGNNSFDSNV